MTWHSTVQVGPGAAQRIIDDLELGPRVAMVWASGTYGCARDQNEAHRLRRIGEGQLGMFDQEVA